MGNNTSLISMIPKKLKAKDPRRTGNPRDVVAPQLCSTWKGPTSRREIRLNTAVQRSYLDPVHERLLLNFRCKKILADSDVTLTGKFCKKKKRRK